MMTTEEFIKDQKLSKEKDKKIIDLFEEKGAEYEKLVEEHRKQGDLTEFWQKERDNNPLIYWVISAFSTESERSDYSKKFDSHINSLIEEHKEKGDVEEWIFKLKANDSARYKHVVPIMVDYLREYYSKIYAEHRKTGDLIDYLWELSEKHNLDVAKIADGGDYASLYPLEMLALQYSLNNSERKELKKLEDIISCFGKDYENLISYTHTDEFKYIFKLSQCDSDSIEFKRYQKIRSRVSSSTLMKIEKSIEETKRKKMLLTIGIPSACGLVLILVASLCIGLHVTKDARMAKKEAQRIEQVKIKKTKDIKKAQAYDLKQVEKLAGKIAPLDILVQTPEPSMYVIAPMAYDTKKFAEDNSHDSAMFGFKTVDNSVKRLGILENCITDFQNKVDGITGVSFLDRSKISQIEKEHKFQLGDWSNNKKTAEIGKALNANILMFLDKFTYVDVKSGEYRFEAKFIDVSTMQTALFNVVYKNPKKKVVTPEVVSQISFKDFTPVSTKNDSFDDELSLKTQNVIRTVQNKNIKTVSPLGKVKKLETSEFDVNVPKTEFYNTVAINFDGFGELEMNDGKDSVSYPYTFDANEIYLERNGSVFYTDGKIGVLTVKTEKGYEKFDVFTNNNREYYIRLGSVELEKAFVNYYLQMVKR